MQFAAVEAAAGRFTVRNRHDCNTLSGFGFDWQVTVDGVPLAPRRFTFRLGPFAGAGTAASAAQPARAE
ncbi:hypothetical protein [Sphingomonas elodea]|uniref:hypothetical protein n=1 Tax=Sphingomonas elodea TaxID=179878 RepID=UPI0002630B06|nr:hypothetical protein [Sphingomonas elodea]